MKDLGGAVEGGTDPASGITVEAVVLALAPEIVPVSMDFMIL